MHQKVRPELYFHGGKLYSCSLLALLVARSTRDDLRHRRVYIWCFDPSFAVPDTCVTSQKTLGHPDCWSGVTRPTRPGPPGLGSLSIQRTNTFCFVMLSAQIWACIDG